MADKKAIIAGSIPHRMLVAALTPKEATPSTDDLRARHVEVLRQVVDAFKAMHSPFNHDYVKDEKCCARCKLLKKADDAIAALSALPAAGGAWIDDTERQTIETLLSLAYAAWCLADNTEDSGGEGLTVERSDFAGLEKHLDSLDALPDDQPGYTMGEAAKARWALRRLLATTPQPSAAEPKCKNCGDSRKQYNFHGDGPYPCRYCTTDAAVGAQGEWPMFTWSGLAPRKLGELRKQGWAVNGYALYRNGERGLIDLHGAVHWIAAPAAGKGVDDATVERALEAQTEYWDDATKHLTCEACKGSGEDRAAGDWCGDCGGQGMHFDGDESGAMRAALEAALTRQPVAGDGDADFELWQDGEFVAGSSGPRAEAWREILHYAAQYEQDGAVTIMEVIRRPIAAPAATPTDGGEG